MTKIITNSNRLINHQDHLKNWIQEKIDTLSEELELSTLERIIISENFTKDVKEVQLEYQMISMGHTNKGEVSAAAIVLFGKENNILKHTIILNDNIAVPFVTGKYIQDAFHLLHHELYHVHDQNLRHKIEFDNSNFDQLDNIIYQISASIWSEYFALRSASKSHPGIEGLEEMDSHDFYFSTLKKLIISCESSIIEAISNYRFDADIENLLNIFSSETSLLLKISATTMGYIDGLSLSKHKVNSVIENHIRNTYLKDTWNEQRKILNELFEIFPAWKSKNRLLDLKPSILSLWEYFGIFPEIRDDKLYISVPLTKPPTGDER